MKDQVNFLMDILGARCNEAIDDLITQGTPHEDALADIERGKQSVAVAEIVTDLEARGIDPEVLDDLVHDCADATSTQIANDEGDPEVQERSEEHTYELQSLMRISYAVFCLKKKKSQN